MLARELGVTIRTLRKRLAHLEEMGYVVDHRSWVEMHEDLVLTADCVLMTDLPPLSDEEFAATFAGLPPVTRGKFPTRSAAAAVQVQVHDTERGHAP